MPVQIRLKLKYRIGQSARKNPYRARTGPNCCSVNCASRPKGVNWRKFSGLGERKK